MIKMKLKTCYSLSEIDNLLLKYSKKHKIAARIISELLIERNNWRMDADAYHAQMLRAESKNIDLRKAYYKLLEENCNLRNDRDHNLDAAAKNYGEIIRLKGKIEAYEKILKI